MDQEALPVSKKFKKFKKFEKFTQRPISSDHPSATARNLRSVGSSTEMNFDFRLVQQVIASPASCVRGQDYNRKMSL